MATETDGVTSDKRLGSPANDSSAEPTFDGAQSQPLGLRASGLALLEDALGSALTTTSTGARVGETSDMAGLARPGAPREPTELPTRLGRYSIQSLIGSGGMGRVVEAIDTRDGSIVALKLLRDTSPERAYRFKREFRAIADLDHPNLVALHDLELEGGALFFTMERLDGWSFVDAMCGPGTVRDGHQVHARCLDFPSLCTALAQLTRGLLAVHAHGLVHRDIKPSNVLVTCSGRVVILDLGLVREAHLDALEAQGGAPMFLGTPLYMAPEQIATAHLVGPAADWYAVGELLFHCLAGRARLAGLTLGELLEAKRAGAVRPPSALVHALPSVPEALDALCVGLLCPDPSQRLDGAAILERLGAQADGALAVRTDAGALARVRSPTPSGESPGSTPVGASRSGPVERPATGSEPGETAPRMTPLGRDDELAQLWTVVARVGDARGRPAVAWVSGTSGIGKSALIEHVLHRARQEHGALVLAARCSERESIPYKAVDSAIDALALELRRLSLGSTETLAAARPSALAALIRVFPVLGTVRWGDAATRMTLGPADAIDVRRRAFGALRALLSDLSAVRPLVVALDDLQWVDLDSVELLEALLTGEVDDRGAPPLTVIVSHRAGAEASSPNLARLRASLSAMPTLSPAPRLELGPLDDVAATALARRLLSAESGPITDDWVARIVGEAQGNPFFLGELARWASAELDRHQEIGPSAETVDRLSLDQVVHDRLAALSGASRRVMEVVSLAGGRLPRRVTSEALDADFVDRAIIAGLRAAHLLRSTSAPDDEVLETYHDRIREAAVRGLEPAARPAMHAAIAGALERCGSVDVTALALHYREAGDRARGARYALAAAQQAEQSLAFDRAVALYRSALEQGDFDDDTAARHLGALGEALGNAGRLHESAQAYRAAAARGASTDEQTEWLRRAAESLLIIGQTDEGRDALGTLLPRVGVSMPRTTASAVASLIGQRIALKWRGLDYALQPAEACPPAVLRRLDALWAATRGLIYTDGILGAAFHARHLRLALDCGDATRIVRALAFEAHFIGVMGGDAKSEAVSQRFAECEALATSVGSDYSRGLVHEVRGMWLLGCGAWRAAKASLDRAILLFRQHGPGVAQEISYCEASTVPVFLYLGHVADLVSYSARLLRESEGRSNPYVEGFARGVGTSGLVALDRVDEVREQLEIYHRDAPRRFEAHLLNYLAQSSGFLRYQGRSSEAWAQCEAQWPVAKKATLIHAPYPRAEFLVWRGFNAVSGAKVALDPRPMLRVAHAVGRELERLPIGFAQGYGAVIRASATALEGRPEQALEHLRRAIGVFRSFELGFYLNTALQRLATLAGGDEGRAAQTEFEAFVAREGIVRPESFTEMMAPGFERAR